MTNEQAIKELQESYDIMRNHDIDESESYLMQALNMAIKALQEQNCDQCEVGNPCLYCEYEFKAQADGEYISKGKMLMFLNDMRFGIAPDETVADDDERREREAQVDVLDDLMEVVEQMPSVDIPPEHDGCKDCRWQSQSETEMPCKQCKHNYTDEWEREKPTDTITMTREEFSEKLMEHYRQGRADEKDYQNGEIMQSFNPD